jgi:hypothetical protein
VAHRTRTELGQRVKPPRHTPAPRVTRDIGSILGSAGHSVSHSNRRLQRNRRQADLRARRRALKIRAKNVGVPWRSIPVIGAQGSLAPLRSTVRTAENTQGVVEAHQRALEAIQNLTSSDTPGILQRGLIGSAVKEITGNDISDDVRNALYGDPNPSLAQIALVAAPVPALRGAETLARGVSLLRGGERVAATAARAKAPVETALETLSRSRAGRAVGRAEEAVSGAAERAGATRAGQVAARGSQVVRAPARVAWRNKGRIGGTAIASPVLAGVPLSAVHGNLDPLKAELQGRGIVGTIAAKAGNLADTVIPGELASNFARDALELPAQAIPSLAITGTAAVDAVRGDPTKWNALVDDFVKQDFMARLFSGDLDGAAQAFSQHPLYAALEVSGASSLLGRGAGAVGRAAGVKAAGTAREPLKLYGNTEVQRRYSPDVIRKSIQVLWERAQEKGLIPGRGEHRDPNQATPAQIKRNLLEGPGNTGARMVDRDVAGLEALRRANREREIGQAQHSAPGGRIGRARRAVPGTRQQARAESEGVSLMVQRIIRSPESWDADLAHFQAMVEERLSGLRSRAEVAAAQDTLGLVERLKNVPKEMRGRIKDAAEEYIQAHGKTVSELSDRGLIDANQAAKAAVFPYARVHMGADYKEGVGLVDREGNALSLDAIHQHMGENRIAPAGFVTHRPGARGAGSFYRSFHPDRQTLPKQQRTGEAAVRGTFDASFDALVEQRVRSRSILDAVKGFDHILNEYGLRPEGGYYKSTQAAREAAPELERKYGIEFTPMRLGPLRATKAELEAAKTHGNPSEEPLLTTTGDAQDSVLSRAIEAAGREGEGQVVLVPRFVKARLDEHFLRSTTAEKAKQSAISSFKGTVLPLSTKWAVGNVLDIGLRSIMAGLGAGDYILGRRLIRAMDKLDPEAAAQLQARVLGGAHFGSAKGSRIHRTAEQFRGTNLERPAKYFGALRRTPGLKQIADGYGIYRDAVFELNSRFIERPPQIAALGKEARRELQATTGRWHSALMVGDKALTDLAEGLRNTSAQVRYGRAVEDVVGRWLVNSPGARKFLSDYAPFYMWLRAATRFVAITLPTKHPVKTALLVAATEMSDAERVKVGLAQGAEKRLPSWLQGAIPTQSGGALPFAGFTSFGVFADYPDSVANSVLPWLSLDTLKNLDFTGQLIKNQDGTDLTDQQSIGLAFYTQAEAMLPMIGIGRRIMEGGGSSDPQSTIFQPKTRDGAAGTIGGGLNRVFNPFRTYSAEQLDTMRNYANAQQITVPAADSSSGSSAGWWDSSSGDTSSGWWDSSSTTADEWWKQ